MEEGREEGGKEGRSLKERVGMGQEGKEKKEGRGGKRTF